MPTLPRSTQLARRYTVGLVPALVAVGMLFGQPLMAQQPLNLAGTADDGMVCRAGYTGNLSGGAFKCSKSRVVAVNLDCKGQFPNYVIRANASTGTPDGRDLCTRGGITLGSTDPLGGLVQGTDYVRADVKPSVARDEADAQDAAETAALGLTSTGVDAVAAAPVLALNASGSRDKANLTITLYTFGIISGATLTSIP